MTADLYFFLFAIFSLLLENTLHLVFSNAYYRSFCSLARAVIFLRSVSTISSRTDSRM